MGATLTQVDVLQFFSFITGSFMHDINSIPILQMTLIQGSAHIRCQITSIIFPLESDFQMSKGSCITAYLQFLRYLCSLSGVDYVSSNLEEKETWAG